MRMRTDRTPSKATITKKNSPGWVIFLKLARPGPVFYVCLFSACTCLLQVQLILTLFCCGLRQSPQRPLAPYPLEPGLVRLTKQTKISVFGSGSSIF
jgi:hypothetical protein